MKVQLNPAFDKLSGRLNRIVFFSKAKEMVDDSIIASHTYARALSPRTSELSIVQANIILAFQIVTQKFNALKLDAVAYQTWVTEAAVQEALLLRTVTAIQLFRSFYLTKYVSTLGVFVQPIDLSNGTSLSYVDRDSRVWS
ncbi:MAG: hypothetical protein OEV44_02715 [Spirochaetota bacterium]|nr:hypothetical protein [Spirochaetota bacterium]